MFGNLGVPELLVIMGIALLVFGAKRLPEIGSSLGKGIREFKSSIKDMKNSIEEDDPTPSSRQLDAPASMSETVKQRDGEPKKLSE
jgi:sec-independent protein translocase protein TatA